VAIIAARASVPARGTMSQHCMYSIFPPQRRSCLPLLFEVMQQR